MSPSDARLARVAIRYNLGRTMTPKDGTPIAYTTAEEASL
jgi:hypothetical protein